MNKAGQIYASQSGISNPELLFQGKREDGKPTAKMTGTTAEIRFNLPVPDSLISPTVTKVIVRASNRVIVDLEGYFDASTGFMPRSNTQSDGQTGITEHTFEGLDFILPPASTATTRQLIVRFIVATDAIVDSIDVYINECALGCQLHR